MVNMKITTEKMSHELYIYPIISYIIPKFIHSLDALNLESSYNCYFIDMRLN